MCCVRFKINVSTVYLYHNYKICIAIVTILKYSSLKQRYRPLSNYKSIAYEYR